MTWIDIEEPDPEYVSEDDTSGVFQQGWAAGACLFNRLEGCWADGDSIYFVSTSGGDAKNGDLNSPTSPSPTATARATGRSGSTASGRASSSCTTSRRAARSWTRPTTSRSRRAAACWRRRTTRPTTPPRPTSEHVNRLIGISPRGEAFTFAVNVFSESELAGVCFSPDGKTLFVNLYGDSTGTPERPQATRG